MRSTSTRRPRWRGRRNSPLRQRMIEDTPIRNLSRARAEVPWDSSKRVVNLQRKFDVVEYSATTGLQDQRAAAILTNYILVVAHQNHRAMSPSDEQRIVAFLVEPGVTYCDHFVDQETFKIDRQ